MTHQEILTKAIEKAIAGGWDSKKSGKDPESTTASFANFIYLYDRVETVIFNRDFAKALWPGDKVFGDKATILSRVADDYEETDNGKVWQAHLQLMVIADDPIVYLGKHLEK